MVISRPVSDHMLSIRHRFAIAESILLYLFLLINSCRLHGRLSLTFRLRKNLECFVDCEKISEGLNVFFFLLLHPQVPHKVHKR